MLLRKESNNSGKKGADPRSAAALAAAFAAVFPEVVGETAKRVVLGGVVVERALRAGRQEVGVDEALEVMAERRRRHVDMALDVAGGGSLGAGLHDEPKHPQTYRMAERAQLLCVPLQLRVRAHGSTSNILEATGKVIVRKCWKEAPACRFPASFGGARRPRHMTTIEDHTTTLLQYWFSTLDDAARLERGEEPFQGCYQRWYGKDPAIDAEIRRRFEPLLLETVEDGRRLDGVIEAFRKVPRGLLALVVLLDQLPRNMYRDTARMYAHDPLALVVARTAIREYADDATLPLVQRMFLYVPLMHVENVTLQEHMLGLFDGLVERAQARSPQNQPFFQHARDYARRHVDVVARFGRFPHRNEILGRRSTAEESAFLLDHPGF